jgi:hypothetical protein
MFGSFTNELGFAQDKPTMRAAQQIINESNDKYNRRRLLNLGEIAPLDIKCNYSTKISEKIPTFLQSFRQTK